MGEEKLYFTLLKSVKRKKNPVLSEVSQLILLPIVGIYIAGKLSAYLSPNPS